MSPAPTQFAELVEYCHLTDGTLARIRPICADDFEIEREFVQRLSEETKHFRFMAGLSEAPAALLKRLTAIDYSQEMAFIAVIEEGGNETAIGVARYVVDENRRSCEFAIVVSDAYRRRGVATQLMRSLMQYARKVGMKSMHGEILASNHGMVEFMRYLGFDIVPNSEDFSLVTAEVKL